MPELIDAAQQRELDERERLLAEHRRERGLADPAQWDAMSARWCERCGERVPDARRKALPGVQVCVDCQHIHERERKRRR